MTSGQWITWWIPSTLIIFTIWEFVQLYRRRKGNKSALTMSQYVTRQAEAGHKGWRIFALAFPIFILLVSIWLIFHWEGLCTNFELLCDLDI